MKVIKHEDDIWGMQDRAISFTGKYATLNKTIRTCGHMKTQRNGV